MYKLTPKPSKTLKHTVNENEIQEADTLILFLTFGRHA